MIQTNELFIDIAIIAGSTVVLISVIYLMDKGLHREPPKDDNCGSQADDNYTREIKDF